MVVLYNERPIKVTYFHTGKTGKHGSAKTIVKGTDIITDKHVEFSVVTMHMLFLCIVYKEKCKYIDEQI